MARFGLLYLNKGKWKGKQIVPEKWVEKSTAIYTKELLPEYSDRGSYGLLWWVKEIQGVTGFYASGAGVQRIYVIPSMGLVIVHVTNNYQNHSVDDWQVDILLEKVLSARTGTPKAAAKTIRFDPLPKNISAISYSSAKSNKILGDYQEAFLGKISVGLIKNQLILHTQVGKFNLFAKDDFTFLIEDLGVEAIFQEGTPEQKRSAKLVVNQDKRIESILFYY